jgi:hypothetical protein
MNTIPKQVIKAGVQCSRKGIVPLQHLTWLDSLVRNEHGFGNCEKEKWTLKHTWK